MPRAPERATVYCTQCGASLEPQAGFCKACGAATDDSFEPEADKTPAISSSRPSPAVSASATASDYRFGQLVCRIFISLGWIACTVGIGVLLVGGVMFLAGSWKSPERMFSSLASGPAALAGLWLVCAGLLSILLGYHTRATLDSADRTAEMLALLRLGMPRASIAAEDAQEQQSLATSGICPRCRSVIPLTAVACPSCGAGLDGKDG
jgi:ribosomal protein L40E